MGDEKGKARKVNGEKWSYDEAVRLRGKEEERKREKRQETKQRAEGEGRQKEGWMKEGK